MIALKFFVISVVCGFGAGLGWRAGTVVDDIATSLVAKVRRSFK